MPYVRFIEADGFKFVTDFEPPTIDPVATQKVINPLFEETDEYKYTQKLRAEFGELERRRQGILGASRRARNHGELKAAQDAYEAVVKEQRDIQRKAVEHKPAFAQRRLALLEEHAVRFEIQGCQEIDQEVKDTLTDAFALLQPGQALTIEGHVITDEAREAARIARLSDEQRAIEDQKRTRDALATAARMRSRYEIEGRADALEESQKWFEKEKVRIENLYK